MKLRLLRRRHADCKVATWQKYDDLCKGGDQFKERITKYLPKHEVEPPQVYKLRCELAYYLNYCGPIVQFFSGMLFSSPPIISSDPDNTDDVYAELKEDADGKGTDLEAFVQHLFDHAMVNKVAYARVEMPHQPSAEERARMSLADYKEAGLDAVRLVCIHRQNITNWRCDDRGEFLWCIEYDKREELLNVEDEELTITETWTYWSDDEARRWSVAYKKSNKPSPDAEVPEVEAPEHFGRIPIVPLCLPDTLWLMSFLADAALEHFRKGVAQSWSIDRTCYAMPFFFVKDKRKPPTMGEGYYGVLGNEDRAEYLAPPGAHFAVLEARIAALKDEIHRVATQMARGVENNAAAVGRSGQSKLADNTATEVVLESMAHHVCEFIEKVFSLVSFARNDDIEWSVTNPATFDLADANTLITNAITAMPLGIQSAEHNIELQTAIAMAMNAHSSEDSKKKMREQIAKAWSPEAVALMQQAALGIPQVPPGAPTKAGGQPGAQQPASKPKDSTPGQPEPPANDQPNLR